MYLFDRKQTNASIKWWTWPHQIPRSKDRSPLGPMGQTRAVCVTLSRAPRDNLSIVFSSIGWAGNSKNCVHHHKDLEYSRSKSLDLTEGWFSSTGSGIKIGSHRQKNSQTSPGSRLQKPLFRTAVAHILDKEFTKFRAQKATFSDHPLGELQRHVWTGGLHAKGVKQEDGKMGKLERKKKKKKSDQIGCKMHPRSCTDSLFSLPPCYHRRPEFCNKASSNPSCSQMLSHIRVRLVGNKHFLVKLSFARRGPQIQIWSSPDPLQVKCVLLFFKSVNDVIIPKQGRLFAFLISIAWHLMWSLHWIRKSRHNTTWRKGKS
jgi:hypothetical protein